MKSHCAYIRWVTVFFLSCIHKVLIQKPQQSSLCLQTNDLVPYGDGPSVGSVMTFPTLKFVSIYTLFEHLINIKHFIKRGFIIATENGFSPYWRQAITWASGGNHLTNVLNTNYCLKGVIKGAHLTLISRAWVTVYWGYFRSSSLSIIDWSSRSRTRIL